MLTIQEVKGYLQDHMRESIKVTDLARHLHFSTAQVYRDILRLTGCSPQQYIMDYKLEKAVDMIASTSLSFQEISERLGFRYESHFFRQFKRIMGVTPLEYKQHATYAKKHG